MRLAVLITNTDDSAFSRARPDDAEKFARMIATVRPDWECVPFWVCKDEFPEDLSGFDGVMITGSPASVHDGAPWMDRLERLVKRIMQEGIPLFGACFGHQIVAKALGAEIIHNPQGWGHGRLEIDRTAHTPWAGPLERLSLYGSHTEQVRELPEGAQVVFEGEGCPIAGFAVVDRVFTVQHHPEMTHAFITDLVEHYADHVGPEVTARARASLQHPADSGAFAEEIARFFEHAAAQRSAG